jgi:hypothetical protein
MLPNVSMTSRSIANPVIPKREAQRNSQDLLMKKGIFRQAQYDSEGSVNRKNNIKN